MSLLRLDQKQLWLPSCFLSLLSLSLSLSHYSLWGSCHIVRHSNRLWRKMLSRWGTELFSQEPVGTKPCRQPCYWAWRWPSSTKLVQPQPADWLQWHVVIQLLSCAQLFVTLWTAAQQVPLSFTVSQNSLRFLSIESVILSNHLILCRPFSRLPSIFPSVGIFSNDMRDPEPEPPS